MILFIVPLVSPEVASSWEKVCKLFERTVSSICQQTSLDFRVMVVCNEKPNISFIHPYISYLKVDLPLPELTKKGKTLDRGYKVLRGLQEVLPKDFSHVMFVDADDCISKYLVEFIKQNIHFDVLLIQKGYVYLEGKSFCYKSRSFNNICGSCNIIKYNLYNLESDNLNNELFIYKYYGLHKPILNYLDNQELKFCTIPFEGAVYSVQNGENYYNSSFNKLVVPQQIINRIKSLRHYRLITKSVKDEFSLYKID